MGLGFSRDVGAAERERGVNRPSLRCLRSRCSSMLLPVKRESSLLPEAKQSIARYAVGFHCTTGDIPLHILLHITFQWCTWLNQAEDIPNPLPPMALAIRNSLNELRRARGEPSRGA